MKDSEYDDEEDEIDLAIDQDAYEYLEAEDERREIRYIPAIKKSLERGRTPKQIAARVKRRTKGERPAFVLRVLQAARHIQRTDPPEVPRKQGR